MRIRPTCCLLLIAALAGRGAAAASQSLADVARQEEDRRKAVGEGGKVYTNKDLKDLPPPAASPAAPDSTPTDQKDTNADKADSTKSKDSDKDAGVKKQGDGKAVEKDQAYWSGRMKALQHDLDRDQVYADALQSRINGLTTDFVNRDSPVERATIATDREKAIAELARLKTAILDEQKAVTDLEEEARRAGVPAGWLR
jgi:hypothetical protein